MYPTLTTSTSKFSDLPFTGLIEAFGWVVRLALAPLKGYLTHIKSQGGDQNNPTKILFMIVFKVWWFITILEGKMRQKSGLFP